MNSKSTTSTGVTPSDEALRQYAATWRFRLGHPARIEVSPDGHTVLFLRSGARDFARVLYAFDTVSGEERVVARAEDLVGTATIELTAEEKARRERLRLAADGIADYVLSADGTQVAIALADALFIVDVATGRSERASVATGTFIGTFIDLQFSPAGGAVAFARGGALFHHVLPDGPTTQVSPSPADGVSYGTAEFVAQEEMSRMQGYWWAPDGQSLVFQRTDESEVETLWIGDPSNPAAPAQPWRYPRAGRVNADVSLWIAPVQGGEGVEIRWDRAAFPYLARVVWPEHGPLTLVVQARDQRSQQVLAADESTGATRTLWQEEDPAWINLLDGFPAWLDGGSTVLWATERGGAWQLEERRADGTLVHLHLSAEPWFRELLHVDSDHRQVWLAGHADPTQVGVAVLDLDASRRGEPALTELTSDSTGLHHAVLGAGSPWVVHEERRPGEPPVWRVRPRTDRGWGEAAGALRSVGESPVLPPHVEFRRTGHSNFAAAIVRPSHFDPKTKYPVILHVYGGPHAQMVQRDTARYALMQWIAEHGYVVVHIDGRGTPSRGRAFERAVAGRFHEIPLADKAQGLRELAHALPELDLDRVGVFGWSFGGYMSALAAMEQPELFRAAVSGAPVTDWLDYDTHYTERYLGVPASASDAPVYVANSLLERADKLSVPLLLIHGTADDNVYMTHSLRLARALFDAGKPFEFLPLAGETHGVTRPDPVVRLYGRILAFFERKLRPR